MFLKNVFKNLFNVYYSILSLIDERFCSLNRFLKKFDNIIKKFKVNVNLFIIS